tara:strand:+ start:756 stop:1004 length:249 start_codon:yes stop_codon:yes gene_type:complete
MGKVKAYFHDKEIEEADLIDKLENQRELLKEMYVSCNKLKYEKLIKEKEMSLFIHEIDRMIKDHDIYIDKYYIELEGEVSPI